jgi:branched-chain amino acid aminotransferase
MGIESRFIWMDGKLVPYDDAKIHVLSHTLHYGLGVFEGIRSYRQPDGAGGVFKLDEHVRRLVDSAKMCRMEIPYTKQQIRDACLATLQANEMPEAYIRPIVYFGEGSMGLGARNNTVHLTVAVWNWGRYLGEEGIRNGIRVQTSTFTRHHVNSNLQRAKVIGHYVNSILARYEANENGYDEAVMLDGAGYVAEGTGENLFVARDGVVKTPPVVNILGGLTRRTVIDILNHEGTPVHEMHFGRDALYVADEVFLSGTAAEITPVREVDRRLVGTPGPITRRVQEVYADGVRGKVDWMRGWVTRF